MAKKSKKKNSLFRRGLHLYLSLLCFVAALLLIVLWVYLSRYQSELDRQKEEQARREAAAAYELAVYRAPQNAFVDFLEKTDGAYWTAQWFAAHPESLDDESRVQQYFDDWLGGSSLQSFKDASYAEQTPVYLLKNDAVAVARVTLEGAGLDWTVSRVELLLEGSEAAELSVPDGFTVYCNGKALTDGEETGAKLFDMESYASQLRAPASWKNYRVEKQLFEPVLTAEPPAGREVQSLDDGTMFYSLGSEEAVRYQERAENFIYDLLRYYMLGNAGTRGNMERARNHVAENSPAYTMISETYEGVIWDTCYSNASYEVEAGPVFCLAENCLFVEVKYHAEGSAGSYTNVADGVYRIYYLDRGYGYQIYVLAYR